MSIFPGLFESVKKQFYQTLNEIEGDLYRIQNKIGSKLISIIGTANKYEGVPLINSVDDDTIVKKFSKKISENLPKVESLIEDKEFNEFVVNYHDLLLFFKPLLKNIGLLAIVKEYDNVNIIKIWINTRKNDFKNIFEDIN